MGSSARIKKKKVSRRDITAALKLSEDRFSQAYQTSPDAFSISSLTEKYILDVNNGFEQLTGFTREEAIGRSAVELGILKEIDRDAGVDLVKKEGKIRAYETQYMTKSGESRVVSLSMDKMMVDNHPCILTIARDITEEIAAGKKTRQIEKQLTMIFQSTSDSMMLFEVTDSDSLMSIAVNDATVNMLKKAKLIEKEDDLIGKSLEFLLKKLGMTPPIISQRQKTITEVINNKKAIRFNGGIKISEHKSIQVEVQYIPIITETNYCSHLLIVYHDITDIQNAKEELIEREKRLAMIFNSTQDAMFLYKVTGTGQLISLSLNEAMLNMLKKGGLKGKYTKDSNELIGKPFGYVIKKMGMSSKDIERRLNLAKEAIAHKKIIQYKGGVGPKMFTEGQMIPIMEKNGACSHLLVVNHDITDLRISEEKFQKLFDANPHMTGMTSAKDGKILIVNNAFCEISGYSQKELIGKTTIELNLYPETKNRNDLIIELKEKGSIVEMEWDLRIKSGKILKTLVSIETSVHEGEPVLVWVITDITERKKSEAALMESEKRFRRFAEVSNEAIGIAIEGIIHDVNSRFIDLSGYSREELIGQSFFTLVHPDDHTLVSNTIRMNSLVPYEHRIIKKNKEVRYVEVRAITTPYGEKKARIATILDITDRKFQEEELKKTVVGLSDLKGRLEEENTYLREEIKLENNFESIIFGSDKIVEVLKKVEQVAATDATVLILGETGTGKELIARAIHNISDRSNKPLVKVNCAALPRELIESELFGYEKGAFTGAMTQRIGRFELAHNGSIFLDEIGELPLESQVKILRVLQEGEIERLGSNETKKVNVRVIAATNRNLENAINEGAFRSDLFYRLNIFPLILPPLRERPEDIPMLVHHFVNKLNRKFNKSIKIIRDSTIYAFQNYAWPGNVRELENIIERAMIVSPGDTLLVMGFSTSIAAEEYTKKNRLKDVEKEHITAILKECSWKVDGINGASKKLDLAPSTLRDKMKKLGIKRPVVASS